MNHKIRDHHIKAPGREREVLRVTLFHFNAVLHPFYPGVLKDGLRPISTQRRTIPNVHPRHTAFGHSVRRCDGQQSAAAADV